MSLINCSTVVVIGSKSSGMVAVELEYIDGADLMERLPLLVNDEKMEDDDEEEEEDDEEEDVGVVLDRCSNSLYEFLKYCEGADRMEDADGCKRGIFLLGSCALRLFDGGIWL